MATTLEEVYDHLFAAIVSGLEGTATGKFRKIYGGTLEVAEAEKPCLAVEVLEAESTRVEAADTIWVMELKFRIGFRVTTARPGDTALVQIAYVNNFLDDYTPPVGAFGLQDRKWSITAHKTRSGAQHAFADMLTKIEVNVERGANAPT